MRAAAWLRELTSDGISVSFAPARAWPDGFLWLLRRLRRHRGPTVVHSHFSGYDLLAAAAGALIRPRSVVFWHVHSRVRAEPAIRARNVVKYTFLGRGIERFLCVAPDIADAVRNRGARRGSVQMLPNAVDPERFRVPTADERAQARRELGLPARGQVLLHFGWDWERKGGDIFLEAVRLLLDTPAGDDMVAVSVGGGEDAHELTNRLGLDKTVRVLEARDDVSTFYAAADIFVSPSRAEGMPFSMIEALATGLSVVASDIPGQALIGQDVAACRLVSVDAREVASAVSDQLDLADQGFADVENTRRLLGQKVDLAAWAQTVLGLYVAAIDSRAHR